MRNGDKFRQEIFIILSLGEDDLTSVGGAGAANPDTYATMRIMPMTMMMALIGPYRQHGNHLRNAAS